MIGYFGVAAGRANGRKSHVSPHKTITHQQNIGGFTAGEVAESAKSK